jgi:hypothetical protein
MSPITPTTSVKHNMTLRDRSMPKPKPADTTSTADNKSNKVSKPSKVTKNSKNNNASKNKAKKPKKIMARYIFAPKALQTLQLFKNKYNAQFVDGYLKRLSEEQNAPEKGIEITVSVSEGFEFSGWTQGMIFRDIKFAAEMGIELDESEFKMKWDNLE